MDVPFPDPLLQSLLRESYPTLSAHAREIHLRAFPATGSDIPLLPPENYTVRSLVPLPPAKTQESKSKRKSEEHVRFDRLRWGWIALVVFSAAFYIAQSGVVQAVRNLDLDGLDEDDEDVKSGEDEAW
jgi:sorting and assembly machinery component 37